MQNTLIVILVLFVGWGVIPAIDKGVDGSAKFRCYELQRQASQFENFYLASWEKQMCDSFDIMINEPAR